MGESDSTANSFLYARKTFALQAKPIRATVQAAANTRYKLYVNGHYVGKGSIPSGRGYTYYDTHDITDLLAKGDNVIAFLVHYSGDNAGRTGRPGLLCQVEAEVGEETVAFSTDETWKVLRAPDWSGAGDRIGDGLGFQEVYDAAALQDGWNTVKFRERGWENAAVLGASGEMPWGRLVPRVVPLLSEQKVLPRSVVGVYNSPARSVDSPVADLPELMAKTELSPLTVGAVNEPEALTTQQGSTQVKTPRENTGVVIILDFGREVFGNLEIGVANSASGLVDIGYSETLEDGRVKPNRFDLKYADSVRLKKGRLEWQSFDPRGFRYVQLEFRRCTRPVILDYVRVNESTYPLSRTGSFECSDPALNEIWRIGAETVRLCMADTFMSSPWSELGQWWGDARIESRAAFYAFGDSSLLAQALRQIADTQRPDGAIPGMYPVIDDDIIPDYALLWVFSILDYYGFAKDTELPRKLYPNVERLLQWFRQFAGEDGLLADVPGRLFIDHAEVARAGTVTSLNCLYYQGLRVAGVIASIIGRQDEAEEIVAAASRLRIAINKHLYSPERGLYAERRADGKLVEEYSRHTNVLAALFDIPDHYQKSTICRQLLNGSLPPIATPYFTSYLLEMLYSADLHHEALDIIREKWGRMIDAGATTLWEFFNQQGGLCHGWSACPTRDLIAEFVGIKPVLGSQRFSVAPHTGGLKWARGSVETHAGPLTVDWRSGRDYLVMKIDVPQGLRIDVYPPGPPASRVSLDGKPQPGRFLALGAGSHQIKVTAPRPERAPKIEESVMPSEVDHVEVLGEVYSRWPRRERGVKRRGKVRLSGMREAAGGRPEPSAEEPTAEAAEELLEVTGVEPVESAVEAQTEDIAHAGEAGEAAESPARSKRRRSRRGRRKTDVAHPPVEEAAAEAAQEEPVEAPISGVEETRSTEPEAEGAPEVRATRRRRSRRGGRRHRSSAAAVAAEGQAEVGEPDEAAPSEAMAVPETVPAELETAQVEGGEPEHGAEQPRAPRRRRRYRSSSSRRRTDAVEEPGASDALPPEPPADES